jgi:hypothetical protein
LSRFRKKPVVVEAEQWFPGKAVAGVTEEGGSAFVVTAHGQKAYLAAGDWVIAEPGGRGHYPCKPDIFAATYEPVGEGQT